MNTGYILTSVTDTGNLNDDNIKIHHVEDPVYSLKSMGAKDVNDVVKRGNTTYFLESVLDEKAFIELSLLTMNDLTALDVELTNKIVNIKKKIATNLDNFGISNDYKFNKEIDNMRKTQKRVNERITKIKNKLYGNDNRDDWYR